MQKLYTGISGLLAKCKKPYYNQLNAWYMASIDYKFNEMSMYLST